MQGKELPKQEATGKSSVGVDVGKSFLDIHVLPSGQSLRLPNTKEGIRRLKRFLKGFDLGLVVLEATGKWHRAAHRSLCADGVPVAVVDPFKARMFAKASGILSKKRETLGTLCGRHEPGHPRSSARSARGARRARNGSQPGNRRANSSQEPAR